MALLTRLVSTCSWPYYLLLTTYYLLLTTYYQIGLYLQLAVLSSWGELGLANLPGGIWFFTIAGYLSVLEHDSYERALPFDLWRADDHHMHHAYFSCNYSPYSVLWDKVCMVRDGLTLTLTLTVTLSLSLTLTLTPTPT